MDKFITIDYMGTFIGMVAIVVLITQFTKDLIDKVAKWLPTKYIVFVYSLIVIFGYQFMSGTFDSTKILLTIINAMLLTMTAQGGYEWLYKPVEQKAASTLLENSATTLIKNITPSQIYNDPIAEKPVENTTTNITNDIK